MHDIDCIFRVFVYLLTKSHEKIACQDAAFASWQTLLITDCYRCKLAILHAYVCALDEMCRNWKQ